ncbi:MAG: hypothetical protein ACXVCY_18490 [Pseudobdellovibrionaceae bacterium]
MKITKSLIFCIFIVSISAKAIQPLTVTDHLEEVGISNGIDNCDYPNVTCPSITYEVQPHPKNPKSVKNLILHLYLANCFYDKGVFSFWDVDNTLKFFYSIGKAQGSACSSTATQVNVPISVMSPGIQKILLNQDNGKKTIVEFEAYYDLNQEIQIHNIQITPDQI